MFPLLLLVLGLGVALTAYELSPHVRARVDDYARALRAAHAAHRAADAHLSNAHVAAGVASGHVQAALEGAQATAPIPFVPPPSLMPQPALPPALPVGIEDAHAGAAQVATDAGIDHAIAATVANQQAAQSTADAARSSRTAVERQAAADSAARVLAREKKIEAALVSLGVGQCGVRSYERVTPQVKDTLLARLHAEGMIVTGDNPWVVDTQLANVKLRAVWDPRAQVLRLIVISSAVYAPCEMIWARIEPTLRGIIGP